jgi:hypothetical protein
VGSGRDDQFAKILFLKQCSVPLIKQTFRADHHSRPNDRSGAGVQDSGGDEVKLVLLPVGDHGMPGVIASGISNNEGSLASEDINELSFRFVAPLGTDNYKCWHGSQTPLYVTFDIEEGQRTLLRIRRPFKNR